MKTKNSYGFESTCICGGNRVLVHPPCNLFFDDAAFMFYRRYIAMVKMCQVAGNRDQLISLLLPLAEHVLNVIIIHFQDRCCLFPSGFEINLIFVHFWWVMLFSSVLGVCVCTLFKSFCNFQKLVNPHQLDL